MLQMLEKGFYWVGNRIYGPDLRYRADQPQWGIEHIPGVFLLYLTSGVVACLGMLGSILSG